MTPCGRPLDKRYAAPSRLHRLRCACGLIATALLGSVTAHAQLQDQNSNLKVDFDKDAPFAKYKTYAWMESPSRAEDLANHIRITRAIEKDLAAKALVPDSSGKPDVFVRYYAKIETKVRGASRQAGSIYQPTNLRTIVDIERVKQGTLIIELLDGETRDVVWRAVASDAVARADLIEDQINTSVAKLLAKYPPAPDAPSPQP